MSAPRSELAAMPVLHADAEHEHEPDSHAPTLHGDVESGIDHEEKPGDVPAPQLDVVDEQELGALRMEALYQVFGKGWKLYLLWGSIALISWAYALQQSTTYSYLSFATSAFGTHTITSTVSVVTSIMAGVAKPFLAKAADITTRPLVVACSVGFFAVGFAMVAGSKNVDTVVAGEVIYTIGNTGISFIMGILISDITPLQWRGVVHGAYSIPYIATAFISGFITSGINGYSTNGWRWGYGMFAIIEPVVILPALTILFWADRKSMRLGALSLASSSYARRMQLQGGQAPKRPPLQAIRQWLRQIDAFGIILMGFSFALLLSPATLKATAKGGYSNPSLIAMYCVGGVLGIFFLLWEWKFASHPIMPRRVLNKTLMCSIGIDFMYYFSGYISSTYLLSYVYVVKDYSTKNYNYYSNALTVGLCLFGLVAGVIQRLTHRYKYMQICGLVIRSIGQGLLYNATTPRGNNSDANLVAGRVLISIGGGLSVVASQVACQASVPHRDMAIAQALLSLWTSIGGSIGSAIAASMWNSRLPAALQKYLGDTHTAAELKTIFGSIVKARQATPRALVIEAYTEAVRPIYLLAFILTWLALIPGILTTNYYLGNTHNAVEDHVIDVKDESETTDEAVRAKVQAAEEKARREVAAAQLTD